MTADTEVPCTERRVTEPKAVSAARQAVIRSCVLMLLDDYPRTSREIAEAIPAVPHRFVHCGGSGCQATTAAPMTPGGCGGHLGPLQWYRASSDAVQRMLVKLEREGLVTRFILEGRQSHLWSVKP